MDGSIVYVEIIQFYRIYIGFIEERLSQRSAAAQNMDLILKLVETGLTGQF